MDCVVTARTLWGVGLSESDVDLTELYKAWASRARAVEIINPSQDVGVKPVREPDAGKPHVRFDEEG